MDTKVFFAKINEAKEKNKSLKQFLASYNVYIQKIMLSKVDPYIEKQNKNYSAIHEKMAKKSTVFDRLKENSTQLSLNNEIKNYIADHQA